MGLREKVALLIIAVVFYKTACSLCAPQSLKEDPFEKYMNSQKKSKSRFVSKYDTGHNQNGQSFQDDVRRQNVFKTYSFPEADYTEVTSPKLDVLSKTSSIDVLSDSALINELRKEKRRKRKSKINEKIYSKIDHSAETIPESFRNQESNFYFTEMGLFPEVQYPLTASETWTPSYWNPLPSNTENAYFKIDDTIYQNKKQKKKNIEAFLKPSANNIKIEEMFKLANVVNKLDKVKNVTNKAKTDNELKKNILTTKLGATPLTIIDNKSKMFQGKPEKLEVTNIQPKNLTHQKDIKKKKLKSLKKIIPEAPLVSKNNSNASNKINSEFIRSRSRSKQFPKVSQSSNKTSSIVCASDNRTMPCIKSTKASVSKINSFPNIQNKEVPNDVELIETENKVPNKLTNEDHIDKHSNGVPMATLTDTISNPAFSEIISEDNFKDYLSSKTVSEVTSINDLAINPTPKNELVEKSSEALINNTFIEKIINSQTSNVTHDSTKFELRLTDTITKPPIESYPAYSTNSLTNLQSNEFTNYPISFTDNLVRKRILDVLSTEKLSVSSLRENILKILLTKEQIPSGIIIESQLTDIPANEQSPKSPSTETTMNEDILEFPLPVSSLIEASDNPTNDDISLSSYISLPSEDIVKFPVTVTTIDFHVADELTDVSKGVISETLLKGIPDLTQIIPQAISNDDLRKLNSESFVTDNAGYITPEETETISDKIIKVISTSSEDAIEAVTEPFVSEALADNLREIISKPSDSRALVQDLREIIRLLTIWNSQIDDSAEVMNKTSETDANAYNGNETIQNPISEMILNDATAVIDRPNDYFIQLISESIIDNEPTEKSIELIPDYSLLSEKPVMVFSKMIAEAEAIDKTISSLPDNDALLTDKPTADLNATFTNPLFNQTNTVVEKPTNDSNKISSEPNNTTLIEKSTIECSKMIGILNTNDCTILYDLNEDLADNDNDDNHESDTIDEKPTYDFSNTIFDSIANDKDALTENRASVTDNIFSSLYNSDTLTSENPTADSAVIFDPINDKNDIVIGTHKTGSNETFNNLNTTDGKASAEKPTTDSSLIMVDLTANYKGTFATEPTVETWTSELSTFSIADTVSSLAHENEYNNESPLSFISNRVSVAKTMDDKVKDISNKIIYKPVDNSFDDVLDGNIREAADIVNKTLTDQFMGGVISKPTVYKSKSDDNNKTDHFEDLIEVIAKPIITKILHDDSTKDISGLSSSNNNGDNSSKVAPKSFTEKEIYDFSHEAITDFELDIVISDDLTQMISNNSFNDSVTAISSSEFPTTFKFADIVSSLNDEKNSDIPISFVSTYTPRTPFNDTLISIQNEIEQHPSQMNISEEKHVLLSEGDKKSFTNVCQINGDASFKNQCYIFEEPDEFNSTSNATDKRLLTSTDESINSISDYPLRKTLQSDISLTDLIMGYKSASNYTTTSQNIVTSSNLTDANPWIYDDEIPDFSDYTLSPEDDTTSDFVDTTLLNNNETYHDQIVYSMTSLKNETLNMDDKIGTDIVPDECDKLSLPIQCMSYSKIAQLNRGSNATDMVQGEYDKPYKSTLIIDDQMHHETDIGISNESTADAVPKKKNLIVPDDFTNNKSDKIAQHDYDINTFDQLIADNISDKSTIKSAADKFAHNLVPNDFDTTKSNEILMVSINNETDNVLNNMINFTDIEQDESDTYMSNESNLSTHDLLPYEIDIGIFDDSANDKPKNPGTYKSMKYKPDKFVADVYNELSDETTLNKSGVNV